MSDSTIAAIATPSGMGGVAVIRVSGTHALMIAEKVSGKKPVPRRVVLADFRDKNGSVIDQGLVIYFQGPHSFTGEDVVELQGHGGIAVSQAVLTACLDAGARLAEPGEFSRRAFLNDKMDLAQAEAVADLISARSEAAVRAASRSMQGIFSREVELLAEQLLALRVYIEAALDFPEEEIDFLASGDIQSRLSAWGEALGRLLKKTAQGRLINNGVDLVLAGKPNAGKSSLLNILVGEERAIVTAQAGTTRDIVREGIVIEGIPVNVLDTAGLHNSLDPVEQEGMRRTQAAMTRADLIILVIDGTTLEKYDTEEAALLGVNCPENIPLCVVYNKADKVSTGSVQKYRNGLWISAKTGQGITRLRAEIARLIGYEAHDETPFIARERHIRALQQAEKYYQSALSQLAGYCAGELVAEDLRLAHDALASITGKVSADDLLGHIFSSFCIGK